jgi:hypothetical protein
MQSNPQASGSRTTIKVVRFSAPVRQFRQKLVRCARGAVPEVSPGSEYFPAKHYQAFQSRSRSRLEQFIAPGDLVVSLRLSRE